MSGVTDARAIAEGLNMAQRCKPGEHRCVALALAFFDEMPGGHGSSEMTAAAIAACEKVLAELRRG